MWKTVKLDDIFNFKNGRSFKKTEWKENGLPIIRIQNLNNTNAPFNCFEGDYDSSIEVNNGDLLFSWSGTVGTSFGAHIWERDKGVLNQHIFKLTKKREIDTRYAFYCLKHITKLIEQSVVGAVGIRHVTKKNLVEFEIPLPPLEEQERIVAKLDAAFTEIESLNKITSLRKAELAKLKKALLLKTLSSEKSDLINLGDVCELIYGKGLDKIDRLENDGIPAYGANGIKAYSTKILSDEPSIIIGRKGSAGELTRVSSAFWALDVTYYTKINKKLIDLDFLYYTLSSMDLPSMAKGVKPGINRNDVYKRLIYLPALEEQKHIVSILDAAYIEIEKVNDSVSKLKNNCDAFKTAILKEELQSSEAA